MLDRLFSEQASGEGTGVGPFPCYNLFGVWNIMPPRRSTPRILHRAWELRQNLTPAEKKLWASLRALRKQGVHFRRQHAIGPYVTDFCAPGSRLVIELDGSQHVEQAQHDNDRTAYLAAQGYRVIRFWNGQVMNDMEAVMGMIEKALGGD